MKVHYILALLVVGLFLAGCASEDPATTTPTGPSVPAEDTTIVVEEPDEPVEPPKSLAAEVMVDVKVFDPEDVTIGVGGTVTWKALGNANFRIADNSGMFDSGKSLVEEGMYEYTYTEPGIYEYRDVIYGTRGSVIVE